jgi:hypothetical protein
LTDIIDKYNDASVTLKRSRMVSKDLDMNRAIPFQGLEDLERDIDNHLTGRWLRSEVQACSVRMYMIFREIESSFGRDGSLREYARSLGETAVSMFNHIRGGGSKSRYTIDQVHGWSVLLTRRWCRDGFQVHILCHPSGVIEPIVSVPHPEESRDSE